MNNHLWAVVTSVTGLALLVIDAAGLSGRGLQRAKQVAVRRSTAHQRQWQQTHENSEQVLRQIRALEEAVHQGLARTDVCRPNLSCRICQQDSQAACPLLDRLGEAEHG